MHPTLARLDDLAAHLATRPDVVAVLGLGSAGTEHHRFDEHSDIDFFVVVEDAAAKARYLADVGWLDGMGELAYDFVNDPNGRKALFRDGLFAEYAVFTPRELPTIPFTGARVVWLRPGAELDLTAGGGAPGRGALDTEAFHVNEALTNLFVGLHRELRGERLAATRFIQVFAIDRVLSLLRLAEEERRRHLDPFEVSRRVELAYPNLPLAAMVPGYGRNADAADAILGWLRARYPTDPAITGPIEELVAQARS